MIRTREQDANLPFPDATYVSYPFVFGQLPFGTWIASAALLIALILTAVVGTPTDAMPFAVWDPALNYEQQEDAVGGVWCVVVGAITLIVTVVFIESYVMHLALVNRTNKLMRSIHFLTYALYGSLLTSLAQQITALMVGVHRPDFISRCRPQPSLEYDPTFPVQYFHRSICLSDRDHDFHEGLKSYPSGHASSSMFLAIYMSGYLLYSVFWRPKLLAPGKAWRSVEVRPAGLELNSPWWHPSQSPRQRLLRETAHLGVLLWIFLNLGWAWGVASSRISDHRHSIADILGGMLLGTVCSVVFLLQAFGIECRLPMYGVPHFNFHDATHRVGTSDAGQAHTVSAGTSHHVPMEPRVDESAVADNSIELQPPSQLAEMAAQS